MTIIHYKGSGHIELSINYFNCNLYTDVFYLNGLVIYGRSILGKQYFKEWNCKNLKSLRFNKYKECGEFSLKLMEGIFYENEIIYCRKFKDFTLIKFKHTHGIRYLINFNTVFGKWLHNSYQESLE